MGSSRHLLRLALSVLVLVGSLSTASAFRDPGDQGFPPGFDRRPAVEADALRAARADVASRFAERFGGNIVLRWGDLSDRPVYAFRPGGVLAVVPGGDRVAAVKSFLRAGRDVFGLSDAEVDALEAARVFETPSAGMTHLRFLQRVDGVSVFRGQVRVNLDDRGGVLNVAGEYFPGIPPPGEAAITPEEALRVAAVGLGLSGTVPDVMKSEPDGERRTVFRAGGEYLAPPVARLTLLPETPGKARLTWEVVVWEAVSGWDNRYRTLVDARTGKPVLRERMTLYVVDPSQASGLVFEQHPEAGPQVDRSFAGDPVASPANWVQAGQKETRGNNVVSRADWGGRNQDANNPLADGGNQLQFDFSFTDAYALTGKIGDTDAAITNAFYIGNLYHDLLYDLGFDEASGNFQDDNFGRGGLGGDHVNVDVQDSYSLSFVRNNANFNPTNDGSPPRTNYYLWTNPFRDGAFDGEVIYHEFTHGLSTRLVGGPSTQCLPGVQGGGMGEGWSDWFAVSHYHGASEDPAGPATVGAYVTGNYDRGIRRYPYHYDTAIDPLTYADLCDNGSCEVHDEGEIWATVLWDMRHDLILQYGFDEGKLRSEQVVVDGMKLSACSPNFVTMRDSILQADQQRYAGQDECLIRSAFARRGLGALATSNGTGGDATADFTLVAPLDDSVSFAADKATLSWNARQGAVSYPVDRGTFGPDATANTFSDAACLGDALDPSFQDAAVPAAGGGFYYLVAVTDACGSSDFGAASDGTPRVATGCP